MLALAVNEVKHGYRHMTTPSCLECRYNASEAKFTIAIAVGLLAAACVGLPIALISSHPPVIAAAVIGALILVPMAFYALATARRRLACKDVILRLDERGLEYSPYGKAAASVAWRQVVRVTETSMKGGMALKLEYIDETARPANLTIPLSQLDEGFVHVFEFVKQALQSS